MLICYTIGIIPRSTTNSNEPMEVRENKYSMYTWCTFFVARDEGSHLGDAIMVYW